MNRDALTLPIVLVALVLVFILVPDEPILVQWLVGAGIGMSMALVVLVLEQVASEAKGDQVGDPAAEEMSSNDHD